MATLVHGGPSSALGLFVRNTSALIPFLDVLGFAFLLVAVARLITAWHLDLL
jgi:hypothetical protein